MLGAFDFNGIELELPRRRSAASCRLSVGDRELRLIEVGPAHTRGDTLVHAAAQRALFSGDILFSQAHPIAWAGPVSNWIAACDRILALDVEVIVPGHGPLADLDAVRELKAYFEYLYEQARARHAQGMTPLQAASSMSLDRWAGWREPERLVVNIANIYAEISRRGAAQPAGRLRADGRAGRLALSGLGELGPALRPRHGLLQLGRQRDQRRLLPWPARQHHADRQPLIGPVQRQAHGRQPGDVAKGGEQHAAHDVHHGLVGGLMLGLERRARLRRQKRTGGRERHVEVAAPAHDLAAAEHLQRARCEHVVEGAHLVGRRR